MLSWKEGVFTCPKCEQEYSGNDEIFDMYFSGDGIMCESCCRELTGIKEGVNITDAEPMIDEYTVDSFFENQQRIRDDEAYLAFIDPMHIH